MNVYADRKSYRAQKKAEVPVHRTRRLQQKSWKQTCLIQILALPRAVCGRLYFPKMFETTSPISHVIL
jgi:hypothetical protein